MPVIEERNLWVRTAEGWEQLVPDNQIPPSADRNVDGGSPTSVYTPVQRVDGGSP